MDGSEESEDAVLAAGETVRDWVNGRNEGKRVRRLQGTRHTCAIRADSTRGHCWRREGATASELKALWGATRG